MKTFCPKCERHHSLKKVSIFFEEDNIHAKVYYECKECKHSFAEIEKIKKASGQEQYHIKPDLWWETDKINREYETKDIEEDPRSGLETESEELVDRLDLTDSYWD